MVWIPGIPIWKGLLLRGTTRIPNHRAPNHQFTISWIYMFPIYFEAGINREKTIQKDVVTRTSIRGNSCIVMMRSIVIHSWSRKTTQIWKQTLLILRKQVEQLAILILLVTFLRWWVYVTLFFQWLVVEWPPNRAVRDEVWSRSCFNHLEGIL